MSDYRDPNDPSWRNAPYDPNTRGYNASWGWIAGAVFLVIVLAIAFGIKHEQNSQTASNDITPPATHLAPLAPPSAMNPVRPMAPLPTTPASPGADHP